MRVVATPKIASSAPFSKETLTLSLCQTTPRDQPALIRQLLSQNERQTLFSGKLAADRYISAVDLVTPVTSHVFTWWIQPHRIKISFAEVIEQRLADAFRPHMIMRGHVA